MLTEADVIPCGVNWRLWEINFLCPICKMKSTTAIIPDALRAMRYKFCSCIHCGSIATIDTIYVKVNREFNKIGLDFGCPPTGKIVAELDFDGTENKRNMTIIG